MLFVFSVSLCPNQSICVLYEIGWLAGWPKEDDARSRYKSDQRLVRAPPASLRYASAHRTAINLHVCSSSDQPVLRPIGYSRTSQSEEPFAYSEEHFAPDRIIVRWSRPMMKMRLLPVLLRLLLLLLLLLLVTYINTSSVSCFVERPEEIEPTCLSMR